jgi:DNA repair protein RecO (recombination protein O)
MEERTTGLILRTRPLTESSLIVNWLSADLGRIATVAKGARRPKSSFRGKLDLFYEADFSFSRSRRSELHNLREVRLRETHEGLRRDIDKLQQIAYAAALIDRATETETPVSEVHELMTHFVAHVDRQPWRSESVIWFELKLLVALGLQPDSKQARLSPRTRRLLDTQFESDVLDAPGFQPDPGEMKELVHFLQEFIIFHLDRLPPGRPAALKHE